MPLATTGNLLESVGQLSETNHSIYKQKLLANIPNFLPPKNVLLYYMKFNAGGQPDVKRYLYEHGSEIPYELVEGHITRMARSARNTPTNPMPVGTGISGAVWDRRSYIALVMDSPSWRFVRHGANDEAALIFNPSKGSTDNHSFFDASDMFVDITGTGLERVSAVYFINHMRKNQDGDIIRHKPNGERDSQLFVFDLFYKVTDAQNRVTTYTDDPTGTNLGPPVGDP